MKIYFNSELFINEWKRWKQYKKEQHRFTYKGEISEEAALKRLFSLSNGNEGSAIDLIENAIECGWKGIYPIKTETNNHNVPSSTNYTGRKLTRHEAGIASTLASLKTELNARGI